MQKGASGKEKRVKAEDGRMLIEKEAVRKSWLEYFESLLYVEQDREAEIVAVGREEGINVLGELNDSCITREEEEEEEEVLEAVKVGGSRESCRSVWQHARQTA